MWSNERVGYTSISILTRYEQWALAMDGGGIGFKFTNKRGAVRAGQQRGHWTTKLITITRPLQRLKTPLTAKIRPTI